MLAVMVLGAPDSLFTRTPATGQKRQAHHSALVATPYRHPRVVAAFVCGGPWFPSIVELGAIQPSCVSMPTFLASCIGCPYLLMGSTASKSNALWQLVGGTH
jgi:hypothetical protein